MLLDQPTENNVHAGEEVDVVDNPSTTPSTSVDNEAAADARRESNLEQNESTISPYAYSPVAIDVGPGLATYWVPKYLLRSPKWSTTDAGGTLCLPGVSAATGHTLVHYLYTGTYQTLQAKGEDAVAPAHIKFKQALLTFVLASAYELPDLEKLAKEQIERHGSHMAVVDVLDTVRKEFSKMARCWFHEYMQARTKEQFDLDFTFFTSKAFINSVGEGALHKFMACHLVELFSAKLTHILQRGESRCLDKAEPDAVLDEVEEAAVKTHHCPCYHGGHRTGMCTASDETSFESLDVSCEMADDVVSLESSVWDETSPTPPELEPVPPPEPEPLAETEPETVSESSPAPVEEEEEAELKKKEENEATVVVAAEAVATNASTDISWPEPASTNNDDWESFSATATPGKKKKGKKGKVRHLGYAISHSRAEP
ncbi:hypothetical protein PSPO01_16274 [Paraphaeosphaeria sporulosa]